MFRPERMVRVTFIYPRELEDKLTYALLKTKSFQPTKPSKVLSTLSEARGRELSVKVSTLMTKINSLLEKYKEPVEGVGESLKKTLRKPTVYEAANWNDLVDRIEERVRELERALSEAQERGESGAIRKYRQELLDLQEALEVCNDVITVLNETRVSKYFAQTAGFIPKSRLSKALEEVYNECGRKVLVLTEETEEAPTHIEYPWWLKPFMTITCLYGAPNYREISPVPFLAFTFPLFFGLMFADTGHGIFLILAGLLIYYKFKEQEGMRILGMISIYFGIFAAIAGFFSGEFFGPAPPLGPAYKSIVKKILGIPETELLPLEIELGGENITPVIMWILILSIKIGILQMLLGFVISIINEAMRKEYLDLFTVTIPQTLVFIVGTLPFLLAIVEGASVKLPLLNYPGLNMMWVNTVLGLLVILAFAKPLACKLLRVEEEEGFGFSMFEAFDFLLRIVSNTASYMRILALLMAHIGLMYVFYVLGNLVAQPLPLMLSGIAFGIVYALGNIITIGLESIIVFAHTARLHFYEWFSKFYLGDGVTFTPVKASRIRVAVKIGG